jgi:hypothetical protein
MPNLFREALGWLNDQYGERAVRKRLLVDCKISRKAGVMGIRRGENIIDMFPRRAAIAEAKGDKKKLRDLQKWLEKETVEAARLRGWRIKGGRVVSGMQAKNGKPVTKKDAKTVWKWRDAYTREQIQLLKESYRDYRKAHLQWANDRAWRLRQAVEKVLKKDLPAYPQEETIRWARRIVLLATLLYHPQSLSFSGEFGKWVWGSEGHRSEGLICKPGEEVSKFVAGRETVLFGLSFIVNPPDRDKPIPVDSVSLPLDRFCPLVDRAVKELAAATPHPAETAKCAGSNRLKQTKHRKGGRPRADKQKAAKYREWVAGWREAKANGEKMQAFCNAKLITTRDLRAAMEHVRSRQKTR